MINRVCKSIIIFNFYCNITSYTITFIRTIYNYNNVANSKGITHSHFIFENKISFLTIIYVLKEYMSNWSA